MAQSFSTDKLDPTTSRAVAKGVGEKLQRTLSTEQRFPERLQKLLEKMRNQEAREVSEIREAGGGSIVT